MKLKILFSKLKKKKKMKFIYLLCVIVVLCESIYAINDAEKKVTIKGKKKSIVDLDDADVERLFDEWEVNK